MSATRKTSAADPAATHVSGFTRPLGAQSGGALVVDDHPAVRAELTRVLSAGTGVGTVHSAATAAGALGQAIALRPRIAVVDYRLPGRDGLSLTLELKRLPEAPGIVIYSAFTSARLALAATVAGADGLVEKTAGAARLCAAVDTVLAGSRTIPDLPAMVRNAAAAGVAREDLPMVRMLVEETPPDQVARSLGISRGWLDLRRWAVVRRLADADGGHGHVSLRGRG